MEDLSKITRVNTIYDTDISTGDIQEIMAKVKKAYKNKPAEIYDHIDKEPLQFKRKDFFEALPQHPEWRQVKKDKYYDFRLDLDIIII